MRVEISYSKKEKKKERKKFIMSVEISYTKKEGGRKKEREKNISREMKEVIVSAARMKEKRRNKRIDEPIKKKNEAKT